MSAKTMKTINTVNLSFITTSAFYNNKILMNLTADISFSMSHKNHHFQ